MKANNLSECLFSREIGSLPNNAIAQQIPFRSSWAPKLMFTHMEITNSVVWIKGRDNYVISLNKSGKAAYRSILPFSNPVMLSEPNEHVYKICLSSKGAFFMLKRINEPGLQFFVISEENLKNGIFTRTRILERLAIELKNYEEIDYERQIMAVKVDNTYQLWSLETENIIFSFPSPPNTLMRYFKGFVILCTQEEKCLVFTIQNVDSNTMYRVKIMGKGILHHFLICQNWLVVSIKHSFIQLINLLTRETKWIKKSGAKQFYEMENENESMLTFSDGTAVLITDTEKELSLGFPDGIYADVEGMLIAYCESSSSIKVLDLKTSTIVNSIEVKRNEVTCIGINEQTHQIFVGFKSGKICVLD
ncbi:unnamed protein product [Blepharisma stoltei]|uniref:Uncharacterized protein n=1 Tax=Blepharisma stoltei TaxID=1481888 RepID=A0AAU9K758_9CILI|nr:unnamed protein product [Blepharisma stoltei]